jgi:hypothetical protein
VAIKAVLRAINAGVLDKHIMSVGLKPHSLDPHAVKAMFIDGGELAFLPSQGRRPNRH